MSDFRYPQPENEHSFEEFCLILLRDVWKLPTLEKFGKRGVRQFGVDLIDLGDRVPLHAAQCKHREPHKLLEAHELNTEIEKAKTLPGGPIGEYWVLTTARKDTGLQLAVRDLNVAHQKTGLFRIRLKFWTDIESLIDQSPAAQRHLQPRSLDLTTALVEASVASAIGPVAAQVLHMDIDAAKAHLDAGALIEAQLVLRNVRTRCWATLTPQQRSRWKTLSAEILLRQGKPVDAAASLLEAYADAPDDPVALANAVAANRMAGRDEEARELARNGRASFPLSADVWAAVVENAASAAEAEDALRAIPSHLRNSAKVVLAIASRDDLRPIYPSDVERAPELAPRDFRAWWHFGQFLLAGECRRLDPATWESPKLNPERLARAADAFTRVAELCALEGRTIVQADALTQRATVNSLRGRLDLAREDVEAANVAAPNNPNVALTRAKLHLELGEYSPAIALLTPLAARGDLPELVFLLSSALWNRNQPGDRDEATRVLGHAAESDAASIDVRLMALDGYLEARRVDDARALVDASRPRVTAWEHSLMTARVHLAEGAPELAASAAMQCLAALPQNATRSQVQRTGRLLVQVERFHDALPLFERLRETLEDAGAVRAYVHCAWRLELHREVLSACKAARERGLQDEYLLEREVTLLSRYDPAQAITVLEERLRDTPTDDAWRVQLVSLAATEGRDDVVQTHLAGLPGADVVSDAAMGSAVADILGRYVGRGVALDYGYSLLVRFFHSVDAHRAFIRAVLCRDSDDTETAAVEPPQVAGAGVAVALQEVGERDVSWFVLEDSPVAAEGVENQILPNHGLWQRLAGCRVGDNIEVGSGIGAPRTARIIELLSKITFRFRNVMERWELRFPAHREFAMSRFSTGEDGQPDVAPLVEFLKDRREALEQREAAFRDKVVPIAGYATICGESVFETALKLVASEGTPIRCCTGTADERRDMLVATESAEELVLDGTALCAAYSFGLLPQLLASGKSLVLTHSVASSLRDFGRDAISGRAAGPILAPETNGRVRHSVAQEETTRALAALDDFRALVARSCRVASAVEVANMPPATRRKLGEVLHQSTLDAIAVASIPGRLLWTDDGIAAHLARQELGTDRVWTQGLLLWLLEKGLVDERAFATVGALMVAHDYSFTSVSFGTMIESGCMAEWNSGRWPVTKVISHLSKAEVRPDDALGLAARFLVEVFTRPLPVETRRAFMERTCEALAGRTEGKGAVAAMSRVLPRMFGLNIVGLEQAMRAIELWHSPPSVVLSAR